MFWSGRATDIDATSSYSWYCVALDRLTRTKNTVKKAMNPAQLAEAERQVRHRITKSRKIEPSPSNQTPLAYQHSIGA